MTGDAFPNADVVVTDPAGKSLMVHSFETSSGPDSGPYMMLWGNNSRDMGSFSVQVPLTSEGTFK
jgi:hypothetical protein